MGSIRLPAAGRRLAGLLAAVSLVAGLPAFAQSRPDHETVESLSSMDAPGLAPLISLARAAGATPALEHFLPVLMGTGTGTKRFKYSFARYTPDWSGDGRPDRLAVTYLSELVDGELLHWRTLLSAYEGNSGRVLWRHRTPLDTLGFPIPARVGRGGAQGFFLIETGGTRPGTREIDYTLRAMTGDARQLWKRTWHSSVVGAWPVAFAATDYVVTLEPFNGLPGSQDELLIALGDVVVVDARPFAPYVHGSVIQASVVNGKTGDVTDHVVPTVGAGPMMVASSFPDFDGDGLDDYIFMTVRPGAVPREGEPVPTIELSTGVVEARRGTDGLPLWIATGLDLLDKQIAVADLGNIVGGPAADVLVETNDTEGRPDHKGYVTYLIDGDRGSIVWSHWGQWSYSPGDIDGDGRRDLLLQSYYTKDRLVATRVWALRPNGSELWSREYRSHNPVASCCSSLWDTEASWEAGDLNGDGLVDASFEHWRAPKIEGFRRFAFDARSSRILASGGLGFFPLEAQVDGRSDDVAQIEGHAGHLLVRIVEGRTGALLVRSEIAFDRRLPLWDHRVEVAAARLDGDQCADVSLTIRRLQRPKDTYEVTLDGSDGTLMWASSLNSKRRARPTVVASEDHNPAC